MRGLQILDSRGRPTVEARVRLSDGNVGRAAVPSGASTGTAEAFELRDGLQKDFAGKSVRKAVGNIEREIDTALHGIDAIDQRSVDQLLVELDGTERLERLGANAILAVSLATCRASANSLDLPLYRRIAELFENDQLMMPVPMVNILSGGLHAERGMDIQDFLFVPATATSIEEAIHLATQVRTAADNVARELAIPTLLADEGGLSPGLDSGRMALEMMTEVFERAGLIPGERGFIAIDIAATTLQDQDGSYRFVNEGKTYLAREVINLIQGWLKEFPIVSIEDALGEDDWSNWKELTLKVGHEVQLIGDDLFTTNLVRLKRGIADQIANSVLIKLNQNGTLSGTFDVIKEAKQHGYATIISARSGETEDSFIADLAVGTSAGQIKIGSVRNSERLSKYNQLLRIEKETRAPFAGASILASWSGNSA